MYVTTSLWNYLCPQRVLFIVFLFQAEILRYPTKEATHCKVVRLEAIWKSWKEEGNVLARMDNDITEIYD